MITDKNKLRQEARKILRRIDAETWTEASFRLTQKLSEHPRFREAQNVFIYLPMVGEPDTLPLIEQFFEEKNFFVWDGTAIVKLLEPKIKTGKFPFPLPKKSGEVSAKLDLAILPVLLFDQAKHRLGHGTGWCDRFLAKRNFYALGVGLECQLVAELPHETHDQPLDEILTEK